MARVTVPFTLEVVEVPPVEGTFLSAIDPTAASVRVGSNAIYHITFTTVDGFAGMIQLAVLNLPEGANAEFTPNPAAVTDTVELVIGTTDVLPGLYNLEYEAVEADEAAALPSARNAVGANRGTNRGVDANADTNVDTTEYGHKRATLHAGPGTVANTGDTT